MARCQDGRDSFEIRHRLAKVEERNSKIINNAAKNSFETQMLLIAYIEGLRVQKKGRVSTPASKRRSSSHVFEEEPAGDTEEVEEEDRDNSLSCTLLWTSLPWAVRPRCCSRAWTRAPNALVGAFRRPGLIFRQ